MVTKVGFERDSYNNEFHDQDVDLCKNSSLRFFHTMFHSVSIGVKRPERAFARLLGVHLMKNKLTGQFYFYLILNMQKYPFFALEIVALLFTITVYTETETLSKE
jgi:hypothetical protein